MVDVEADAQLKGILRNLSDAFMYLSARWFKVK